MESLRVVSAGRFDVSGIADDGEDIVSVAAGADVIELSEPVVLVPLAQLATNAVVSGNAAQIIIALNRLFVFFIV